MKKISFQHQNTKAKANVKDYSKHYNKDVKIIQTDGTENNGKLINIMTNNHGKKTITIEKKTIHPYEQYYYNYQTHVTCNLVKEILLTEEDNEKNVEVVNLCNQHLCADLSEIILEFGGQTSIEL